jgi:hypothetical protein
MVASIARDIEKWIAKKLHKTLLQKTAVLVAAKQKQVR